MFLTRPLSVHGIEAGQVDIKPEACYRSRVNTYCVQLIISSVSKRQPHHFCLSQDIVVKTVLELHAMT